MVALGCEGLGLEVGVMGCGKGCGVWRVGVGVRLWRVGWGEGGGGGICFLFYHLSSQ